MEGDDLRRKLATILVADIVGYSRLTANDEDWTIRALGDFRAVVDEIIRKHEGRIFSTGGDSILAEFASPVEAVRCAVDFQEAARSRNLMQPRDRQLRYRIGINLGDVMIRGNDLLGDGVNVAARLEGLAEPGGICVSGTVWDQINGKLSIGYIDIGEQAVKNIPRPVRAYHLRPDGESDEAAIAVASPPPPLPQPARRTGSRGPMFGALAGGLAVLAVAGIAAWQFWPRGAPVELHQLPETRVAEAPTTPVIPPAAVAPPPASSAPASPPQAASAPPPASPPQAASAPSPPPQVAAAPAAPVPQMAPGPKPSAPETAPKTFRDCPNCPEMVVIPAGSFTMGAAQAELQKFETPAAEAAHEQPQHRVTIAKPFALAKFDVTRAEYAAFVAATHFQPRRGCQTADRGNWQPQPEATWESPGYTQTDRDPVVCMNIVEVDAYLGWLRRTAGKAYRLPTEAEWEYAARAGTTTPFYWGDALDQGCSYENLADQTHKAKYGAAAAGCTDGFADTAPVGSFKPNPFGLYDMVGNVFVFTADCWNESYTGAPSDGSAWMTGDCQRHPARAASFGTANAGLLPVSSRHPEGNLFKRNRYGFRVALSLE